MGKVQFVFIRSLFFVGISLLFWSCVGLPRVYVDENQQFAGMYGSFMEPGEKEIEGKYHMQLTQKPDGNYVKRLFYPETRTLVEQIECEDRNCKIKTGMATKWQDNGYKMSEGRLIKNVETGPWVYYSLATGEKRSEGSYKDGDREGTWKSYDEGGWLSSESIYVSGERNGKYIHYDSLGVIIEEGQYIDGMKEGAEAVEQREGVEKMPRFPGCESEPEETRNGCASGKLLTHIYKNIRYPAMARENGIEGTAYVNFVVDSVGNINDINVYRGVCEAMKKEVEYIMSEMPQWIPGEKNGKKVKVLFTLPVKFKLQ